VWLDEKKIICDLSEFLPIFVYNYWQIFKYAKNAIDESTYLTIGLF